MASIFKPEELDQTLAWIHSANCLISRFLETRMCLIVAFFKAIVAVITIATTERTEIGRVQALSKQQVLVLPRCVAS